jgi:hypothetical protein
MIEAEIVRWFADLVVNKPLCEINFDVFNTSTIALIYILS